ncbi:MAG: hypothetical protein PHR25_05035 [Clostridia bacterium]|nr:hypothetical protein [Clostridia bacterium]MDD4376129.1 hypothetical protein [Clostridia bacterium]
MVDKKASKIRKYKVNGAVLASRLILLALIIASTLTIYNNMNKNNHVKILEDSAFVDENGISNMVSGVKDGGVYNSPVEPTVNANVKKITLTKDGKEIKFRNGKKIKDFGNYILTIENSRGEIDTIYFDIEY